MNSTQKFLDEFPEGRAVIVLSGGMDSTIAARLAVEKLGCNNVHAISFYYQQKQSVELDFAKSNAKKLGIKHSLIDISFLGDIVQGVSSNIVGGLSMPTIKDILGDPAPSTEVPFRNGILLMIAAAYAQSNSLNTIVTGVQSQDEYSYFDTTPEFIENMNRVLSMNRMHQIKIHAPWQGINKATEIECLYYLDGNIDLLSNTLTCYNPNEKNESCGICPSCSERLANFVRAGFKDQIPYSISIRWDVMLNQSRNN
jgi:7-cyano-7-deazaguanine synthase